MVEKKKQRQKRLEPRRCDGLIIAATPTYEARICKVCCTLYELDGLRMYGGDSRSSYPIKPDQKAGMRQFSPFVRPSFQSCYFLGGSGLSCKGDGQNSTSQSFIVCIIHVRVRMVAAMGRRHRTNGMHVLYSIRPLFQPRSMQELRVSTRLARCNHTPHVHIIKAAVALERFNGTYKSRLSKQQVRPVRHLSAHPEFFSPLHILCRGLACVEPGVNRAAAYALTAES
ncbi:hypothetical protein HDV57DRAFT_346302 [Trichoderma longibrachiatum]